MDTVRTPVSAPQWERHLEATSEFWGSALEGAPEGSGVVITEGFSQHKRVLLRNLSVANAVRCHRGGSLLLITGADRRWLEMVWPDLDPAATVEYAAAFGAHAFDIQRAAGQLRRARGGRARFTVMGRSFVADRTEVDGEELERLTRATWSRLSLAPPYSQRPSEPEVAAFHEHERCLVAVWLGLVRCLDVAAFVTSHVDYDQWAPGVTETLRSGAPVIHVQSTGGLKAYAVWPQDVEEHRSERAGSVQGGPLSSHAAHGPTFRSVLTPRLGRIMDKLALSTSLEIEAHAGRIVALSRSHRGRPSWWRAGANATLEMQTPLHRRQVRTVAAKALGLDATRPTVAVFNHAVSDAVNSNVEAFDDLSTWFRETVEYGASRGDANWLFLDHPSQSQYDATGFFRRLSDEHGSQDHTVFRRSDTLTKNTIWSLCDLGLTVRGSISNELPAFGIGALQSGWSEWSHAGVSHRADTQNDYWSMLEVLLNQLKDGAGSATHEQLRRGRLWQWFYRSAADLTTPFVPHWSAGEDDAMISTLTATLGNAEPVGDALFTSVSRMWRSRSSVLLRDGVPDVGT